MQHNEQDRGGWSLTRGPALRAETEARRARLMAVLLWSWFGLTLAGCAAESANYKLVPPTTPEGEACVAKCDAQRRSCNESLQNEFEVCHTQYREAMSIYTRCRNSSLGPAPGSQFSCTLPRPCQLPSAESCDEAYRACFQTCGGKVEQAPSP